LVELPSVHRQFDRLIPKKGNCSGNYLESLLWPHQILFRIARNIARTVRDCN